MELELYKKVKKTEENPYGIELCQDNSFLKKPTLLCISAQNMMPKSVFGIASEGMKVARLRTSESYGAGYSIDEFPANFIAIKNPNGQDGINELVDKYICSLVIENGHKLDINQAKKNIRNLNIMTYCNGSTTYELIEERLVRRMQEVNYREEEIREILNECAFIAICTSNPYQLSNEKQGKKLEIKDTYATTFQFLDITDLEIEDETYPERLSNLTSKRITDTNKSYEEILEIVKRDNPFPHRVDTKGNKSFYYYIGNGEHNLKEYTNDKSLIGATISSVVTYCLQNSIKNLQSEELIPLEISKMTNSVNELIERKKQGESIESLFSSIDNNLDYPNAKMINKNKMVELLVKEKEYLIVYDAKSKYDSALAALKQSIESYLQLIESYKQITNKEIPIPDIIKQINQISIESSIGELEGTENILQKYNSKALELNNYSNKMSQSEQEIIYKIMDNEPNYVEILIAAGKKQYLSNEDLEKSKKVK